MALELTVFNDTADPNNSVLLILMAASTLGLFFARNIGLPLAAFTVTYAFAFNAFNLMYFGTQVLLLNGTSAIINLLAAIFLYATIMKK